MYRKLHGRALPAGRFAAIIVATICAAWAAPAAAVDFFASASVGVNYNSNPIELTTAEALQFDPDGKPALDDTSRSLSATVAANTGGTGPLRMQLQGQYGRTESSRYDKLGHDDYGVTGSLDWKPGQLFDVSLAAVLGRTPLRQADVGGQEATQKTTQQVQTTLRLRPTPRLQFALVPAWLHIKLPLSETPDFEYRDTSLALSLSYLSPGRLSPGLEVKQSKTKYAGIGGATRFEQRSISGTLNYQVTGFSSFSLAAGLTERTTDPIDSTDDPAAVASIGTDSTFTGSLSYRRQLTAKTSINISAFRDYQQYDLGVNLTKGTGLVAGIAWEATSKVSVSLSTDLTWSTIDGVEIPGGAVVQREDLLRGFTLGVGYKLGKYVSLQTNVARRLRNSTLGFDQFNNTTVGLQLTAKID